MRPQRADDHRGRAGELQGRILTDGDRRNVIHPKGHTVNIDPAAPEDQPETAQMLVIHRALRRELHLLPDVIEAVAAHDIRRAATVVEHALLVLTFLHEHHDAEDRLLWPLLRERSRSMIPLSR